MKEWENMTLEEKVENLREIIQALTDLVLTMSEQMTEVIDAELEEFRKKYNNTRSYLFGGKE